MMVSLIGMSNVGKSFWSTQLAERGWQRLSMDEQLPADLLSSYHPGDKTWEHKCLTHEEQIVKNFLQALDDSKNTVIDTSGSVIYLSKELLGELAARTTMVYLEASEALTTKMMETYFLVPKPVVWGEHFAPKPHEPLEQTIHRCYPELLSWRSRRYQALSELTIPESQHRDPAWTTDDLLYALLQHHQQKRNGQLS